MAIYLPFGVERGGGVAVKGKLQWGGGCREVIGELLWFLNYLLDLGDMREYNFIS